MDCSTQILNLRQKENLSQKELAKLLGVSNRAVSKWENGISTPSKDNLMRMANIFGVPISAFFNLDGNAGAFVEKVHPSGMKSLRELYRIGRGPSSSHTMAPEYACKIFSRRNPSADSFKVVLYGSLSKTGKGHGTDVIIKESFDPYPVNVIFDYITIDIPHPNTMDMYAYKDGTEIDRARVISLGGGAISFDDGEAEDTPVVYEHSSYAEIMDFCNEKGITLPEYVELMEGPEIWDYLAEVWEQMKQSIKGGLEEKGELPGGLGVQRKARYLFKQRHRDESDETRENRMVCAYAYAVSEQNASRGRIVTAPTCGSCGVVPSVLFYEQKTRDISDEEIIRALGAGGIIGNLIKTNASISGAECGCQAEIGTACAMAAAALCQLYSFDLDKIEYSAEVCIEHHLGLTCDPICGLVQIPCIERNAVAALRAKNAVILADFLTESRLITLDSVIKTMKETGLDISKRYKETSEAGLAKSWYEKDKLSKKII